MMSKGTLVIHVPHYYRRWPLLKRTVNFDVPEHVRPGYHLDQLQNLVNNAGFIIKSSGFSYGFTENMINNLSYFITEAKEKRKLIYAILFPIMNTISWFGQWSEPNFGAGVWVIAEKE